MEAEGYGSDYLYDHDQPDAFSGQNYFPDDFRKRPQYYDPPERGFEREIKKRLDYWTKLRRERPDVVHTYGWISYSVAAAVQGTSTPVVLSARDYAQGCATRTLVAHGELCSCLLYTSDAADERSSVDLGGRRIINKQTSMQADDDMCRATTMVHETT